jgi:hypothetical protein
MNESPNSLDLEGLASRYDCVVLGTSLAPSVVAAAAAFSSHSVLHLDANDYYGHVDDASFTLDQAVEWAKMMDVEQKSELSSFDAVSALEENLIRARVARSLIALRASEQIKQTLDPDDSRGDDNREEQDEVVCTPRSEEEVSSLSARLSIRFLNQSPSSAVRLLSCGAAPLAEVVVKSKDGEGVTQAVESNNDGVESKEVDSSVDEPTDSAAAAASTPSVVPPVQAESNDIAAPQPVTEEGPASSLAPPRLQMSDVLKASRRWSLDLGNPMAILCSGAAVEMLVSSGVGRYLEFLTVDALCILENHTLAQQQKQQLQQKQQQQQQQQTQQTQHTQQRQQQRAPRECWRVPSSKRDIFSSKALGVLEKNRLMKLLRCCHDWGVRHLQGKDDLATQGDGELGLVTRVLASLVLVITVTQDCLCERCQCQHF